LVNLDKIKRQFEFLGKGLISEMVPGIIQGVILTTMQENRVNVQGATRWVEENVNLWKTLKPEQQAAFKKLPSYTHDISWLTAGFFIDAIKVELPAVASLFMGWKKASNWLERQVENIRREIE